MGFHQEITESFEMQIRTFFGQKMSFIFLPEDDILKKTVWRYRNEQI